MIDTDWSPRCSFGTSVITVALSRPQPDTTVCTVAGAVDWNTTPLLRRALSEARWDDSVHLVIDLSAVTSMDSAGPYTLLEARFKHHIGGGGHLAVIADPDSHAIPELQIVALTASFDFHSTLADALHACASADTSTSHEPNRPAIHATCSPTQRAQLATSPVFDK
jgi:anti-sigma B factor antagonist